MAHVTVGHDAVLATAKGRTTLPVTLTAGLDAADSGTIVLRFRSDNGPEEGWGTVTIACQFTGAKPLMGGCNASYEVGVTAGGAAQLAFSFANNGNTPLVGTKAEFGAADGGEAPAWATMSTTGDVGTLEPGEKHQVILNFAPGTDVTEDGHEFHLTLTADNHEMRLIRIFVTVDNSGRGAAQFKITDLYTGTIGTGGSVVEGLAGALIRLQREDGIYVTTNLVSDASGEVFFRDLPEGSYRYTVSANDHEPSTGRIWVQPGATQVQSVHLQLNLVTVDFSVTEITIEDRYEIKLDMTFKTDVPFPVVTVTPTLIALPDDMAPGDVFYGELRLENHGLARADEVELTLPTDNPRYRFEVMKAPPTSVEAKEAVTVPYRVTRRGN